MQKISSFLGSSQGRRLGRLGLGLIFGIVGWGIYRYWGEMMIQIIDLQKTLHAMLSQHIAQVAEAPYEFGLGLIVLSFGYGVFHTLGPGHGKGVIIAYLGTHKESLKKGILISLSAALLQSLVAISLISIFAKLLEFQFDEVQNLSSQIEKISYLMVMAVGATILIKSCYRLYQSNRHSRKHGHSHTNHSHQHGHSHTNHSHQHEHSHTNHSHQHEHSSEQEQYSEHQHSDHCGCNHTYAPSPKATWLDSIGVMFSMGLRPCSGALLVLTYAHLVGVYSFGVVATLAMGLGVGLSVSLIAVGSQYFRKWLEQFVESEAGSPGAMRFSLYLNLLGGGLLAMMGWGLLQTVSLMDAGHPLL